MAEYVIPSFQQFQMLREERRAKQRRQRRRAQEVDNGTLEEPRRGPPANAEDAETVESRSSEPLPSTICTSLPKGKNDEDGLIEKRRGDASGHGEENGGPPVRKRKIPSSPNDTTQSAPLSTTSVESHTHPSQSNRGRLSALSINIPDNKVPSIPRPSPRSRNSAASPVNDDRNDRRCRPWFQKRRKPKMKQMQLSFPSSLS